MSSALETAAMLAAAERRLRREVNAAMAAAGLSFARGKLLDVIETRGPIRPGEIAIMLDQAPRTTATAIDALEADGLVRRAAHPHDRRAHLVTITPKGRVALEEARLPRARTIERMFAPLSEGEHRQLLALLRRLGLGEADAGPAAD